MPHKNTNFAGSEHKDWKNTYKKFNFLSTKSNDKYQSLAFYARNSVEKATLQQSPGRSSFLACKALTDFPLKVLLL